jgi:hypothetical protein
MQHAACLSTLQTDLLTPLQAKQRRQAQQRPHDGVGDQDDPEPTALIGVDDALTLHTSWAEAWRGTHTQRVSPCCTAASAAAAHAV